MKNICLKGHDASGHLGLWGRFTWASVKTSISKDNVNVTHIVIHCYILMTHAQHLCEKLTYIEAVCDGGRAITLVGFY